MDGSTIGCDRFYFKQVIKTQCLPSDFIIMCCHSTFVIKCHKFAKYINCIEKIQKYVNKIVL